MAGTAITQVRSASVVEATAGTIPPTPSFETSDVPIMINATPEFVEGNTSTSGGARNGQGVSAIGVAGAMSGQVVYGNLDGWLETLLQGSWSSDVLKDGKATVTRTVENTLPAGEGGTLTMHRYRGCEWATATITAASRAGITYSADLVGIGSDSSTTTAITGATYTDPTNVTPMVSGVDVGTIVVDGYTIDCMSQIEMQLTYEDRDPQDKISTFDLCGVRRGSFKPIINARIYVEANYAAVLDAARANHTAFAVTVPLGSVSGQKYTLEFPRCHFGANTADLSGQDVMIDVQILPHKDDTEDCVLKITRAVA